MTATELIAGLQMVEKHGDHEIVDDNDNEFDSCEFNTDGGVPAFLITFSS